MFQLTEAEVQNLRFHFGISSLLVAANPPPRLFWTMPERHVLVPVEQVTGTIHVIRGQRVMLDADLAQLYGVTTKR